MSSKSAVKLVVAEDAPGALFRWVAILTGSKNALKGVGFFVGGLLLTLVGFQTRDAGARRRSSSPRSSTVLTLMRGELGRADREGEVRARCSRTTARSTCSRPRASSCSPRATSGSSSACPVFLRTELGWSFWQVGGFLALWVIGYGIVQASRPASCGAAPPGPAQPDGAHRDRAGLRARGASRRASRSRSPRTSTRPLVVVVGLIAFGVVFAHELGRALLPDPRLRRRRQGRDERRLLLHGQRRRAAHRARSCRACSTSGRGSRRACGRPSPSCSPPARCPSRCRATRAPSARRARRRGCAPPPSYASQADSSPSAPGNT